MSQPVFTTLLMEPYQKVHAYTDILPVHTLDLPSRFVDKALQQMEITFRVGPLLTVRRSLFTANSNEPQQEVVAIPKPAKGTWSWLEPQKKDLIKEIGIVAVKQTAQLDEEPTEIIEGYLQLKIDATKPATAQLSSNRLVYSQPNRNTLFRTQDDTAETTQASEAIQPFKLA